MTRFLLLILVLIAAPGAAEESKRVDQLINEMNQIAVEIFRESEVYKRAEQGDALAQNEVAMEYYVGIGLGNWDFVEAAKWLVKAAEQGLADAQAMLGVMYARGEGVPQDKAQAIKWITRAAEQGEPSAQSNLASNYAQGIGVPQDYVLAHKWFNLAAAQNYEGAALNRDVLASGMSRAQIAEAQKLAREWTAKQRE